MGRVEEMIGYDETCVFGAAVTHYSVSVGSYEMEGSWYIIISQLIFVVVSVLLLVEIRNSRYHTRTRRNNIKRSRP